MHSSRETGLGCLFLSFSLSQKIGNNNYGDDDKINVCVSVTIFSLSLSSHSLSFFLLLSIIEQTMKTTKTEG